MLVWTTPELRRLFYGSVPLKVVPQGRIRAMFLKEAAPGDLAVAGLVHDPVGFLAEAKARGIRGPVIFIEPGTDEDEVPGHYGAIILDPEKYFLPELSKIVNFIMKVARERFVPGFQPAPAAPAADKEPDTRPIEDSLEIADVLDSSLRERKPVIVSFQIQRGKELFSARGICEVKEAEDSHVVLHRFKPRALIRGLNLRPVAYMADDPEGDLRLDPAMMAFFSYGDKAYEAAMSIEEINNEVLRASTPQRLVEERRRNVRMSPAPAEPVEIYLHLPGEPTLRLQASDISPHGMGFVSDWDLAEGAVHLFAVALPAPRTVVLCPGVIRFKKKFDEAFRYGVETDLHSWDEENVVRYVMKREQDILSMLSLP
jgi:hypothetical protein